MAAFGFEKSEKRKLVSTSLPREANSGDADLVAFNFPAVLFDVDHFGFADALGAAATATSSLAGGSTTATDWCSTGRTSRVTPVALSLKRVRCCCRKDDRNNNR